MAFSLFSSNKPSLLHVGANRTHVLDKPELTIGRAPNADIVIDDPYLAPIHARVEKQPDGMFVLRRMGLNPIVLRGEPLLQTASLRPGDSFRLGKDVEFQFVVKGSKEEKKKPRTDEKVASGDVAKKPLLKRPAFLAIVGLVYLGVVGAVAFTILAPDETSESGPSAERIRGEASRIVGCIKSARKLHRLSETSFKGAVGAGSLLHADRTYADLSSTNDPADDAGLTRATAPIVDLYIQANLAALTAEIRGNRPLANSLYRKAFDIVPDINCSAGRFVMQRVAATAPARRN